MVVPVSGTIPDSTLTPRQVRQKFSPQTLAGLGDDCLEYDNDGQCVWYDDSGPVDTGSVSAFQTTFPTPIDPIPTPSINSSTLNPMGSNPSITTGYIGQSGALILKTSDGGWIQINQDGSQAVVGPGHLAPSSTQGTITQQQASAWPSVIAAITGAGVRLGTVAMLPAGSSLLPNGTIVGSGQSLIRPGVITSSSLSSTLNGILSNPMLLIGGFGIIALALFAGGGRR